MGYTPLFNTMLHGTLHGRWPCNGVWALLLSLADQNGLIDKTPETIADDIGLDVDELLPIIEELCQPDPRSRSQELGGRRLVLIDPARNWGWRVVNHAAYREKARLIGKNAREKEIRRNTPSPPSPPVSAETAGFSLSDSDSDSDSYSSPILSSISNLSGRKEGGSGGKQTAAARPRALDPEFKLTESLGKYALDRLPNVDVPELLAAFKDHHGANPKSVFKDWEAVWRTWVRRGLSYGYPMVRPSEAKQKPDIRLYGEEIYAAYVRATDAGMTFNSQAEWDEYYARQDPA